MDLTRIVPPSEPVISLETARAHCRVDAWGSPPVHPDDVLLQSYAQAATDELDGADGWLGRALVTQTFRLALARFPGGCIGLPLTSPLPASSPPPDIVQAISYVDTDGAEQTLDPALYRVISEADPIRLERAPGASWPATAVRSDAVRIEYKAGYGGAASVPSLIKSYILMRLGYFYEHREAIIVGTISAPTPFWRDSLESLRARGRILSLENEDET